MTRRSHARVHPASARQDPPDPTPQDVAALQAHCPGWIVMWCRWRRVYSAFAMCTNAPWIEDAVDPARLLSQCGRTSLGAHYGQAVPR
ncbi:hypothetical protein GCM10023195_17560 [Actinoallomurus liliacearum]|uniref:Uncharacterized protein n=1 Tax=Actinoallomurus liliacearum TaxID=1080073 RepID=A0ABP8TDE0_9ACTN